MSVKVKVKASSTIELDKSIVEKIEELAERSDLDPLVHRRHRYPPSLLLRLRRPTSLR